MVKLDVVRSSNFALIKTQPLLSLLGGTSGICEYTLRALVATHSNVGKGLRVYIVGRNAAAAEAIISDCLRLCTTGQFRFIQAEDLALLKDVDRVCSKIKQREESAGTNGGNPRVDILVMSQACAIFGGRNNTKEGLDTLMSLMYYSRMRFIMKLLPLLLASPLPAHIISIFAAGTEAKLLSDDLSLRNPAHYSYLQARSHITYMTTLFMEALAVRHRGKLSLTHVFPGLVITSGFQNPDLPKWFRRLWRWVGSTIAWLYAIPAAESGDRTLFLATSRFPARTTRESDTKSDNYADLATAMGTDGERDSGAYATNWNGESISVQKAYKKMNKEEKTKKVWDHTIGAFDEIEAGKVFAR